MSVIEDTNIQNKRKLDPDAALPIKKIKYDSTRSAITVDDGAISNDNASSPVFGTPVDRREFRRAGPYILGPKIGSSPVESIVQYLAKKEGTDKFVQLKILMLSDDANQSDKAMLDERQGKMLLHTEFSLLSMLADHPGVIQQHGMFSDMAYEEDRFATGENISIYTGKIRKRLILVLDSVTSHDFSKKSTAFTNLQQYLLRGKKSEMEVLKIFYEIIIVVESLHKKNIIHRDLKLGNIILNTSSNKITIANFCLGKFLLNENDLLFDQRGSPAYISPDVLCGTPYKGKPSDMWALGVVLFMMFYGQFPFFESTPSALFKKIKTAEYMFPDNRTVSLESQGLIKGLLQLKADRRMTATQVRERLEVIIAGKPKTINFDQVVPALSSNAARKRKHKTMIKKILNCCRPDQLVPVINRKLSPFSNFKRNSLLFNTLPIPLQQPPQSFLRTSVSSISFQRIGRDARPLTPNEMGQFQFLLPNTRNNMDNYSSGNTIRQPERLRTRANSMLVTHQMRNLSLRHNRRDFGLRGLAWQDLRNTLNVPVDQYQDDGRDIMPPLNQETQHSRYHPRLYRCVRSYNPSTESFARTSNTNTTSSSNSNTAPLLRYLNNSISNIRTTQSPSTISTTITTTTTVPQLVPNLTGGTRTINTPNRPNIRRGSTAAAPTPIPSPFHPTTFLTAPFIPSPYPPPPSFLTAPFLAAPIEPPESIDSLFNAFNEMFIRGRIPIPSSTTPLIEFTGFITQDLAEKIARWLISEHGDHTMIQYFFNHSTTNARTKVRNFLQRCGVRMVSVNGVCKVKREQSIELLMIMTYMLQASGYNNTYFVST